MPEYMYPEDQFPAYPNGPAYVISRGAAKCLFKGTVSDTCFVLLDKIKAKCYMGNLRQNIDKKHIQYGLT